MAIRLGPGHDVGVVPLVRHGEAVNVVSGDGAPDVTSPKSLVLGSQHAQA
jgi:hypothetical protein